MEVYVARQPIFDRGMDIFGYELLYRRSNHNFYEGVDDNQATAELINNAYLSMQLDELTDGSKAFINFSEELLIKDIPLLLPQDKIVVEVLERVEVTKTVVDSCNLLKRNGYMLALDDFVFNEKYLPLIEIADIIKVEFSVIPYSAQEQLIKKYKHKIKFLAEKIETREEHQLALGMGYDFFQGYFYSKPVIIKGKEIEGFNVNLIRIIHELNDEEPSYQRITEIIERDLGLSYKLLKLINSAFFRSKNKIYSIKQALVRLGIEELKKWFYLMMLKEVQNNENKELTKICLIRGKLMELLSIEIGQRQKHLEFFMVGILSSIDILLSRDMKEVVDELPLTSDVKDALLWKNNVIREVLNQVIRYEMADWDNVDPKVFIDIASMTQQKYMGLYIEALKWAIEINY